MLGVLFVLLASTVGTSSGDGSEMLVRVHDAAGRDLGLMSFTRHSPDVKNERAVFISPDGRRLDVHRFKHRDRYETLFFEPATGALLEDVRRMDFVDDDALHFPRTLTWKDDTLYLSIPCSDAARAKALPGLRKEVSTWLKTKAPALSPLLREAYDVSSLALRQPDRPEALAHVSRASQGLAELYDVFEEPEFQLVRLDLRPHDEASKTLPTSGEGAPRIGYRKSDPSPFRAKLLGSRDENLASVHLEARPLAWQGPKPLSLVHLELLRGARSERAEIALVGPAGEYYVNLKQRVGPDWRTIAVIWGISGGKSSNWYEPYVLQGVEPQTLPFEIPPAGENERRTARRRVADALLALVGKSGMEQGEPERFLWRWSRLFSLPEIRDAIPELDAVSAILNELSAPVFDREPARVWLGSLRLAMEENR
ncbi:MAG TPA: hypothetical protein VKF32_10180 [Thermoanaerobaculia bacterium]|nr:hypothetical protein [Thermoanaerobaculia bacterium]